MALQDKIRQRSQPLLEPGEDIQAVVGAHTVGPVLSAIGWLLWVPKRFHAAIDAADQLARTT